MVTTTTTKPCDNKLCFLQVPIGVAFCCGMCSWSNDAVAGGMAPFDPHHSVRCEARQAAARGEDAPMRGDTIGLDPPGKYRDE